MTKQDREWLKYVAYGWLLLTLPVGAVFGVTWWLAPDAPSWKMATARALISVFAFVGAALWILWAHRWVKMCQEEKDGEGGG